MTRIISIAILVFVGVATWHIGSKLSADAIGMAVGVVFGVAAGIPTTLLLIAYERSRQQPRITQESPATPPAPPILILNGPGVTPPARAIEGPTIDAPARSWADVDDW